jgi:hypothetical protein
VMAAQAVSSRMRNLFVMMGAMSEPADQRTLDQIITENALFLIRRRVAGRIFESRPYYLHTLAEEMAPYMKDVSMGDSPNTLSEIDRISKSIARYLGLARSAKISWRVDFVDGFCKAMGVPLSDLTSPTPQIDDRRRAQIEEVTESVAWLIPPGKRRERKSAPDPA